MATNRKLLYLSSEEGDNPFPGFTFLRLCFRRRETDAEVMLSWYQRMGLSVFGVIQNSLAGCLIFGWASIDHTILSTTQETGGAGLTLHETTLIFSWATSIAMFAALILGILLDYTGPRMASVVSCLLVSIGCLVFAVSSDFAGFAVGVALMGLGGPGIGNSIIHLANLFPGNENLAMSCLSGSVALSFSVFAVFDLLWTRHENISFRFLFAAYSILVFMLAVGALILYPDEPYKEIFEEELSDYASCNRVTGEKASLIDGSRLTSRYATPPAQNLDHAFSRAQNHELRASLFVEQPLNSFLRNEEIKYHRTESFQASRMSLGHGQPAVSLKDQPFYNQLLSAVYIRALLVFVVSTFVTNFYVGSISMQLGDERNFSIETRHDLSQWFTTVMAMGVFGAILAGWLIDRYGLEVCTAGTLIFGQLQMALVLFARDNKGLMITSFFFYSLFRSVAYPVFIGSLTSRLGFKYFGVLLGMGFAISGAAQLLFPFLIAAVKGTCHIEDDEGDASCDGGKWHVLDAVQLAVLSLLLLVPIMDYRDSESRKRRIKEVLTTSFDAPSSRSATQSA